MSNEKSKTKLFKSEQKDFLMLQLKYHEKRIKILHKLLEKL